MSLSGCGRRLFVAPLAGVDRQGHRSLGSGGLAVGISHSLQLGSHFIQGTHPLPFVQPYVHQGQGFGAEVLLLLEKGAIELAPLPSPGYYSRLFVVMKASG